MATVLADLINPALSEIGVRSAGETLPADIGADALAALNRMMDAWATERLTIPNIVRTTWTISANDGDYTVGTGANINIARPVFVDHVNFIETSANPDVELPLQKLTEAGYAGIVSKAQTSVYPLAWYYNPTVATGTLILWPTPTSSTLQGAIYVPTAVAQFASLAATITLPNGYQRAIVKNLAVDLAPSFSRQVDPELKAQARESKADIKRANKRDADLSFEAGALVNNGGGHYNIKTDQ